ncbi:MAG: terminase family protein [Arenibacter latericius]|nr:terminase family protein [Arenibacter latericius]
MLTRKELDDNILKDIDFCPQTGMQEKVLLADASFIIFGGNRGGGKAQDKDSSIKTIDGFKRIGDVEVGEIIIDPVGDIQFIHQIHEKGELPVYKFTTAENRSVNACMDHIWDVFVGEDRILITTKDLIPLIESSVISVPVYKECSEEILMDAITSCSYVGMRDCRCITLTGSDGLYITDDNVITHNSFAMMLDPLYDVDNKHFTGQIFRKNLDDIMQNGGLWDKAKIIYPHLGGEEKASAKKFVWKSGAVINFSHLENESQKTIESRFKGLEMPFIAIDEIDQIKFSTVKALITSNRNSHGIRNRFLGSCNPSCDTWLRKWIDWYLDEDGYVIPERDGVVRYFFLSGDTVDDVTWGDTKEEVYLKCSAMIDSIWNEEFASKFGMTKMDLIKDFVFIEGSLVNNKKLIESDPNYIANIAMGTDEDRQRNILGCWNISSTNAEIMVSRDKLNEAFENVPQRTGRMRMSVDVALQGSDNCVIVIWDGLHIVDVDARGYIETSKELQAIMNRYIDKYNIRESDIYYDAVGIGAILTDYKQAFPVQPKSATVNGDESFDNFKSQIMWTFGNLLIEGRISIDDSVAYKRFNCGKRGKLTFKDILQHEITALRVNDSTGKTKMLPKKGTNSMKTILGHSPDFLEACIYGIIWTLIRKKEKSKKKGIYNL